jgi:hypothetical protein
LLCEEGKSGVQGLNKQVGVTQLVEAKVLLYRLVKRLASAARPG